jgi:transposase, IS5 family
MMKPNLFAAQEHEAKADEAWRFAQELERLVDFAALADTVDRAAPRPSRERGGRPPFPTEFMVSIWLSQQMFNLTVEQLEFPLLNGMSSQRFARLRDSSQIPDRMTVWPSRST